MDAVEPVSRVLSPKKDGACAATMRTPPHTAYDGAVWTLNLNMEGNKRYENENDYKNMNVMLFKRVSSMCKLHCKLKKLLLSVTTCLQSWKRIKEFTMEPTCNQWQS